MKRILLTTLGLVLLAIGGIIVLLITAERVGEHKSSTFGYAYRSFEQSWGGEVRVRPASFILRQEKLVPLYSKQNNSSKAANSHEPTIVGMRLDTNYISLYPTDVHLNANLNYQEQQHDWISFNAYEATVSDRYIVINEKSDTGQLLLLLSKPVNARLVNNVSVSVEGKYRITEMPIQEPIILAENFAPGDSLSIVLSYTTKGVDEFNYDLESFENHVTHKLQASLFTNTSRYHISNFGIPHEVISDGDNVKIDFKLQDFTTEQDIGLAFYNRIMHLEKMENMMVYSPVSLVLFLMVVFFFSQIHNKRFSGLHYFFVAIIHIFYFLFIAYLIRFFGIWISIGISALLSAIMGWLYFPNVFGRAFSLKIILPYLFSLTIIFTLIFLLPMLQGISFLVLVFIILVTMMLAITHSDISKWAIVAG